MENGCREKVTTEIWEVNWDAVDLIVRSNPSKMEKETTKAITPKATLPMAITRVKRKNFEPPEKSFEER